MDEPPLREDELMEMRQSAEQLLRLRRKHAVYATAAFFLSCASVIPFSKGHSLYAYAEPFGTIFVYLSMALLLVFIFYVVRAFNAWLFVRDVGKIDS